MEKAMTQVNACDVTQCAYNKHNSCHTLSITVGGPNECPKCDTYLGSSQTRGGIEDVTAGIGACKMSDCSFNESLECNASSVKIGWHLNHPDCQTFQQRR